MWDPKHIITLLILIRFTVDSMTRILDYNYEDQFTFERPAETNDTKPPAAIDHHIGTRLNERGQEIVTLNITVREVEKAFNLTLLAVPYYFMKESGKCNETVTETIKKTMDIHQSTMTRGISPDDEGKWIIFDYIFPGCYYVLMTNDKRESWQVKLGLLNTSYPYLKRKIEDGDIKPHVSRRSGAGNMIMETLISIPLSCLEVTAKIYELNKTWILNDDIMAQFAKEVKLHVIPPSQECTLIHRVPKKECNRLDEDKNFMFKSSESSPTEEEVTLRWKDLRPGGGVYFFRIDSDASECHKNNTIVGDLQAWRLLGRDILYQLDNLNSGGVDGGGDKMVYILLGLAVVVLSTALAAVLTCFIRKSCRSRKELKEKLRVDGLQPLTQVIDGGKLKHILLVYARDEPEFMTAMRNFRYRLKQECKCKVHDVFSAEDFSIVAKLGAHEWVTKLLIDDSKVVWVDTPELRSYFDDKEKQHPSDSRDAAIPFAIKLATGLFQNSTTQYRCHFVVRVKGFEVEDGRDDDPLRVVSPHARYHIPGNFSHLCRDITTTSATPKYKQNPEV